MLDENGFSKGFGFIRFSNEVEQQTAMSGMNGMAGLGGKPIKVSVAVNKIKDGMATPQVPDHISQAVAHSVVGSGYGYGKDDGETQAGTAGPGRPTGPPPGGAPAYGSAEYYAYWQQCQQYQAYQQQWYQWQGQDGASQGDINSAWNSKPEALVAGGQGWLVGRLDEEVEHKKAVRVQEENERTLARSGELWSSLEESGWKTAT